MDMREKIALLNEVESKSEDPPLSHTRSRAYYGYFLYDESVAARIGVDNSETFGRLDEAGKFVPFTADEEAAFRAEHRCHLTKLFDRKPENNVIPFRARKPPTT